MVTPRIRFVIDNRIWDVVKMLVEALELKYIDVDRVRILRSYGSKTRAYARIYGLPRVFQIAYNLKPCYIIELVEENFRKLSCEDKIEVLIHELLHIPKTFSGGLRVHTKIFSHKNTRILLNKVKTYGDFNEFCRYFEA